MNAVKIQDVKSAEEARDIAIEWQNWQSDQSLCWSEVAEWFSYFKGLAIKFDLTDEFRENGII